MHTIRQVLCPVDSSVFAQRAKRYAEQLALAHGAELTLLTVSEGPVAPAILRAARELPADLIVMGTHGAGGFERLLLGSVTEKVLRKAECPVLTVPRLAAESVDRGAAISTIVCGVDRSAASRRALEYAASLARPRADDAPAGGAAGGARLIVVHAVEDVADEGPPFVAHYNTWECWRAIEPEIRRAYEAFVPDEARRAADVELRVLRGKAYRHLLEIARETGADLIVLGTAGWSSPFGATAQHVLRESEWPVLAVPPEPAASSRSREAAGAASAV